MRNRTKALLGVAGGLFAAWVGWGAYSTYSTERVPYETVESFDGVEVRRYPRTVLVETTADSSGAAFGRLFKYISGANESEDAVSMTAPVPTGGGSKIEMTAPVRMAKPGRIATSSGEDVSMTAPVRVARQGNSGDDGGPVTMAFYLPPEYTPGSAPTPTDPRVRLVVEPPRTLAVTSFSWYATDSRVARQEQQLLDALERHGIEPLDRPVLFGYNDPWTPPFMQRNEVAVEIEARE
ncbi:SOUL family heme-binding protein [Halorussus halophilus]|uniref:SOUL family heme-binding protein n=1 Tax=Halorussus halophilus TaxID=2650975 RepID=UPI00130167B7|nr:heme-binding protein [Halorussus halophilus]